METMKKNYLLKNIYIFERPLGWLWDGRPWGPPFPCWLSTMECFCPTACFFSFFLFFLILFLSPEPMLLNPLLLGRFDVQGIIEKIAEGLGGVMKCLLVFCYRLAQVDGSGSV